MPLHKPLVAERKRAAPCIGWAELEEASPYQRKPLRASLARSRFSAGCYVSCSAPSLLLSLRKDFAVFSYDDLVERVRYIGVKDGVGSVRLVIVRPGRKVFLPLSLKERLVNNLESLLLFNLSKSSLFDQIRDQTAPGVRTSH